MKTVFLYAGQGSQAVGMGKDFYETYEEYRNFVDSLEPNPDYKAIMHDGPMEELTKTENTQPCMAIFAAGVTELLKQAGIVPDAAAGLSLGEYGALYAAGVYSAEDYVRITAFRGREMAKAAAGCACSMSAILGLDSNVVRDVISAYDKGAYVTVANYNCPGQCVICGENDAVAEVEEQLRKKGAKRCVRLQVGGPFHTKYMKPAGDALQAYFGGMAFQDPQIPVALNCTGAFYQDGEDIRDLLVRQVQSSVRMEEDLRTLFDAGAEEFIEIGPGNVLAGFVKKTAKSLGKQVRVSSICSVVDFQKLVME